MVQPRFMISRCVSRMPTASLWMCSTPSLFSDRMKFGPTFLNQVSFMKRSLLLSLLLLTMGRTSFGYVNDGTVLVPTMDPALIQLDTLDGIFVNNGFFGVDLTLDQTSFSTVYYETTDTLNYTNNGTMTSIPGFDFENFP